MGGCCAPSVPVQRALSMVLGVQARFQAPVGMALLQDMLFVSDTGNHAIRRIRLATGEVDTLIGS